MTIKKLALIYSIFFFSGCTTTGFLSEPIEGTLAEIQRAVGENIPGGLGVVSSNQRVFYSKKYTKHINRKKEEVVTRITVLGDRRPYKLRIETRAVPSKISSSLENAFREGDPRDGSKVDAQGTFSQIKAELYKRRDKKNLFDDFRPF